MNEFAIDDESQGDIALFTALLGEVLRAHSRKRVLVLVERLRDGFVQLRGQDDPDLRDKLMKRIAGPMVGGLISSTILTLVIIPAVYYIWKNWQLRKEWKNLI